MDSLANLIKCMNNFESFEENLSNFCLSQRSLDVFKKYVNDFVCSYESEAPAS